MFIKNEKPVRIIGYAQSSMTEEYCQVFLKDGFSNFEVISPVDFILSTDKNEYQYIIALWKDMELRSTICNLLDELNLDCVTYINGDSYSFENSKIGKGCFVGFYGLIAWNCNIGNHCYIGMGSGVAHDVIIGNNCIISPGVLIAGRTVIGNNCMFMFKSSVINNVTVCDNVILGAFSNITKNVDKSGNYLGSVARLVK